MFITKASICPVVLLVHFFIMLVLALTPDTKTPKHLFQKLYFGVHKKCLLIINKKLRTR